MYPCVVYHRTKGQTSVASEAERLALGEGWHFDLSHCPAIVDLVDIAEVEDEAEVSVVMSDPVTRRRGRPPKVR